MKIIFKESGCKSFDEMDLETQEAVNKAIKLVEGKTGFKTSFEIWRNCELVIHMGDNIDHTCISIAPAEIVKIKRRANWRNFYAYYRNGAFWASWDQTEVKLITDKRYESK